MTETVLVAMDPGDLDGQRHLLTAAQKEAEARQAQLVVVLVVEGVPHPVGGPHFEEMLARLTREATANTQDWLNRELGPGKARTLVAHGPAGEEILEAARRVGATAIVMGERRRRLASRLLGSAAQMVKDQAGVPVILIPPVA